MPDATRATAASDDGRMDATETDRQRLVALLDEWGVGYNGENAQRYVSETHPSDVVLCDGDAKIDGYTGFFTVFAFNDDGSFKGVSVWE